MTRDLLAGVLLSQLTLLVVSVYLHRSLTHHACQFTPLPTLLFRTGLWLTTGIQRRRWIAVHRYHHAHADDPLDPHSPLQLGVWRIQLGDHRETRRLRRDNAFVQRLTRDIREDSLDRAFNRCLLGPALAFGATCLLLSVQDAIIIWSTHFVLSKFLGNTLAAVGHTFGKHRYPLTEGRDNWWLAFFTAGEGYHNTHHHRPKSPLFAPSRMAWDPGWWLIATLRHWNLATVSARTDEMSPSEYQKEFSR